MENTQKPNKGMWVVLIIILIGLGLFIFKKNDTTETTHLPDATVPDVTTPATSTPSTSLITDAEKKIVVIDSQNFSFSEKEIRVKEGQTVQITLNDKDGFHDLVIDEFGVKTKRLNAGESDTITFVADKKGTFEYYCSVGNHRAMGMKGTLIVE
jgi:plastocyanin